MIKDRISIFGRDLKVILLAGGKGSRLSEHTESVPKPMLNVGGKPLLWHIMNTYADFGHKDFYLALGYKSEIIKDYFINYRTLNSNFVIDLASGAIDPLQVDDVDWRVTLVDTGENSMTGGRVKRLKNFIGDETCLLTYGDGLANIDITELVEFHRNHGKLLTMTAVRPAARFGELKLDGSRVLSFEEKPQMHDGWINGGYFVMEPAFFDLIADDSTLLEREPINTAVELDEIMAYKHDGFWQCADTKRDLDLLQSLWETGAPWKI